MSFTATILRSYTDISKTAISYQETVTDDTQLPAFDGQIAASTSNVEIYVTLTLANLKAFMVRSDQAVTLYTNNPSGSSPQDTISLVANQCRIWTLQTDGSGACPFAGNVTAMYVTNPGGIVANLSIRGICHQHS
jgi:hypothetical protein